MEEKENKKTTNKTQTSKKKNTSKKSTTEKKEVKMEVISDEKKGVVKKRKKMPTWGILLIVLGGFLFILEISMLFNAIMESCDSFKFKVEDGVTYIDNGNLTITKDVVGYYNNEEDKYYVEGYLHNNTDRVYLGIQITYTIYDIKGNVLGESSAYLSCLDKGKTWNFKSVYDEIDSKNALKFELRKVRYDLDYDD